jgi:hypothetical protein
VKLSGLALLLLSGCAGPVLAPAILSERFCLAPADEFAPAPPPRTAPLPGYSPRVRRVAESIGAAPALAELATTRSPTRRTELRQAVLERVMAAQLDIQIALATIDCEGERGDQLRGVLEASESRRNRRLTWASIGAGAATAIATGGLALAGAATASAAAGIAGGAAEASAAGVQFFGAPRGRLSTRRNLLREAQDRPATTATFPPVVWRYLSRDEGSGSILAELTTQWHAAGFLEDAGTPEGRARAALIFGEGGAYSAEDLQARGAMLDTLEAAIGRMNRGLRLLLAEMDARH